MQLLEQRAAIVTGAARGIGLATAKTFAAQGANVVLADINAEQARTDQPSGHVDDAP